MDGSSDMFPNALIHCCLHRNMPKACPYVIMQFLFAFSDNLISEDWFFAEGERFLSFWRCHRPRKRAALVMWCG